MLFAEIISSRENSAIYCKNHRIQSGKHPSTENGQKLRESKRDLKQKSKKGLNLP